MADGFGLQAKRQETFSSKSEQDVGSGDERFFEMKPRTVVITFECETDAPLSILRAKSNYEIMVMGPKAEDKEYQLEPKQLHANVIEK